MIQAHHTLIFYHLRKDESTLFSRAENATAVDLGVL